jgi:hypothetical protein
MNRRTQLAIAGAAVVLAVVLFLVLRPDDDEEAAPTSAGQTTTGAETTTEQTTTEQAEQVKRILVVVQNAEPVGGVKHADIEQGAEVVLVVRSDVEDEVHLHGYDLATEVGPGRPARIRFRADIAGEFETELEDRKVPIAELDVRP